MKFVDAHTHVQFAAFDADRDAVIERAKENDVAMVNVGTQKDTSKNAVELAHKYDSIWATVGLHPIHTEKSYHDPKELGASPSTDPGFTSRGEDFDYDYYKNLASDAKVVGIGECGLDYYRLSEESKEKQKDVFEKHIQLAKELKKPLMIHCRQAFEDLIDILMTRSNILNSPPGAIHFFTGKKEDAGRLLDLGFVFTFGGVTTFARDYDETIKYLPLDHILLETDAPYVSPEPYRGKRNEPSYVIEVCKKIAEIKGMSFEEVAAVTTKNFLRVFKPLVV